MPGRIVPLVNGEYYHIYNRGSDKRNIFLKSRDYSKFRETFHYYQFIGPKPKLSQFAKANLYQFKPVQENKLVEIISYCLMPNHFHFLLRQLKEDGISIFMSQLCNSYTKYFNIKSNRIGPLLQGRFKSVLIENDEQLLHASRYIHLNPIVSKIVNNLDHYPWSSYFEYISNTKRLCSVEQILAFFPSKEKYKEFLEDQIDYGTTLEKIKHQIIDEF